MVQPGVCFNGCCQSQPCVNGGTCIEHCETPKKKFTCKCTDAFEGNLCEQKTVFRSCLDVYKASSSSTLENGFYPITQINGQQVLFYCAFSLNVKRAWTLIESFSRSNTAFQRVSFIESHNGSYSDPINWKNYRLNSNDLMYARTKATMFRSTCNFPQRVTTFNDRDMLFAYLNQFDITTTVSYSGNCITLDRVNIRGNSFSNKRFPVWMQPGQWHFHIDSSLTATRCDYLDVSNPVQSEDNFGYYKVYNTDFLCTTTGDSTTQWWVGQQA